MARDIVDDLYDNLKEDGWVENSREHFREYFLAPGKQGYKNRKALYDNMKEDGYVDSPTYEEFARRLGLHAAKPGENARRIYDDLMSAKKAVESSTQPKQPQGYRPSQQEQAALSVGLLQGNERKRRAQAGFDRTVQSFGKPGGIQRTEYDAASGKFETAYYSPDGRRSTDHKHAAEKNREYWSAVSRRSHAQDEFDNVTDGILGRRGSNGRNAAENAWAAAEKRDAAQREKSADRTWDEYAALGGWEMRVTQVGQQSGDKMASRMTNFDLDRMMDDAWASLGQRGQKELVGHFYSALSQSGEYKTPEDAMVAAKKYARAESDRRLYNLAVEKNMPKSKLEYFARKVGDANLLNSIATGIAVMGAGGKTGDMAAREDANERYRQDGHKVLAVAGTVAGFALDPTTWLSAGVGGAAGKGAMWAGGRWLAGKGASTAVKQAATRQFATSMTGRIAGGVAGGAANFGTFEGIKEMESQFAHGGHVAGQDETGKYINGGYSAGSVAGQFGHGLLMGGAIGWLGPVSGNVSDKLVRGTSSTVGKVAGRAGVYTGATMAEGTIFSVPEWMEGDRDGFDVWTDNMAMMVGFKAKHMLKSAGGVLGDLKASFDSPTNGAKNRLDFESRLRMRMDAPSDGDMALTKDEEAELKRYGYDLRNLVESAERTGDASKGNIIAKDAPEIVSRLTEMVTDPRVSEAARAKMYYYATGRKLPMSTIMKGELYEDGNGGFIVESQGANGVITSRSFKNRKEADLELERIHRQAELNSIELGERYQQAVDLEDRLDVACSVVAEENGWKAEDVYHTCEAARTEYLRGGDKQLDEAQQNILHKVTDAMGDYDETGATDAIRGRINEKYGVDIDGAIRKEANRRTQAEQTAIDEYINELIPDKAKERPVEDADVEDVTNLELPTDEQTSQTGGTSEEAAEAPEMLSGRDAETTLSSIFQKGTQEVLPKELNAEEFYEEFKNPIRSVLGELIKVGSNVLAKIVRNGRSNISGAIRPTLEQSDFVVHDLDGSHVYVKLFNKSDGSKTYNIAVVNKHGELEDYVSSVHIKSDNNLLNKIRNGARLSLPSKRTPYGDKAPNSLAPNFAGKDSASSGNVQASGEKNQPMGRAVMKYQDRPVEVLSGRVVMMEDGTMIDNERSDNSIVIRDLATGKVEMVSPDAILSYEEYAASVDDAGMASGHGAAHEEPSGGQSKYTSGEIRVRQPDGTEDLGWLTGYVDEEGRHEYYVEGDQTRIHYATEQELDDILLDYKPDETQETGVADVGQQGHHPYALNDEFTILDADGNPVRGMVTGEIDVDGMVEIETEEPINGNYVSLFTPEELDGMVHTYVGVEETPASEEVPQDATGNGVADVGDARQPGSGGAMASPAGEVQDGAVKASAFSQIPVDGQGQPMLTDAAPDIVWDALVERSHGDEAIAGEVAADYLEDAESDFKAAEKELKKLQEGKPEKRKAGSPAPTLDERIAAKEAAKAAVAGAQEAYDNAKAVRDHWQMVAGTVQRRQEETRRQQEADARKRAAERAEAEKAEREAREEAERLEREALEGIPEWHMDTPENARKRGTRRFNGQMFTRQEPVQGVAGKEVEVKFSQKDLPKGRVAVIEAEQLQPSHIQGQRNPMFFIEEAQPKNRAEAVSVNAARDMAEGIRPQEITGSATAYTGAPTVNTRGEVIQGNNRSDALRYLWQNNLPEQQQTYKQYILDYAEQLGLDTEAVGAMQHPVLVNMLDVDDAEAIRLGQMTAQDTESGGIERIRPKNVAQKLGDDMRTFANQLLGGSDEEATFGQLVDRNGGEVLRWMSQVGAISNTQYQSAFDSKGNLTAEAKNDLQKVLYQAVFRGGSQQLEEMFDRLPAKAQRAILSTAFRDMDSPFAGRMLPEIQSSIVAYNELMQDGEFASSSKLEGALRAVEAFKRQISLDDRLEEYIPADNFSNFALHLAAMYKAGDMSQSTIAGCFNQMYDLAQGKKAATLFEEADTTEYPLAEVVRQVLGIDYKPAKNGNNNVADGGADVALHNQDGQGGEPRGNEPPASGEQTPAGTEPSERGGGTGRDSRERRTVVENILPEEEKVNILDPLTMPDYEKARRGEMLRNATAINVAQGQIVATKDLSARKAAEKWWDENVGEPAFYDTEAGEVEINRNSIESSLAHKYGQMKLDAITSLIDGFENAVYLGTMPDFNRQEGVNNHFFAYPIMYNGDRCYVFCRAMQDANKNRLYVHEVFVAAKIKKGDTLQTAAFQPHGGISLYRDILANVLVWKHADDVSTASDVADGLYSSQGNLSDPTTEGTDAPQTNNMVETSEPISKSTDTAENPMDSRGDTPLSQNSIVSESKINNSASEEQGIGEKSSLQPSENEGKQTLQASIDAAASEVDTEPTPAQAEAGNYKKGHITIGEFDITIENPAGSTRKGVDADGKEWSTTMSNTYGYINGTEGVDGDHIDVFLHTDMDQWDGRKVFVVDQTNRDGSFDEHKVMLGFNDKDEAMSAYLANYDKTWADTHPGLRISETNIEDFNKWVQASHRKTKPFADYTTVSKVVDDAPVKTEPQQPEPSEAPAQPAATIEGEGYKIEPKPYTNKQGKTLDTYLVTFDRDFSKEELSALRAKAKTLKGWYDRESKGWMLRSSDDAKAFADEVTAKSEDEVADEAPLSMADMEKPKPAAKPKKAEAPAKPTESPMKQVDVEGVFDALKTKGETKLSDHAKPVEAPKPKKRRWISDEDAAEFDSLRDNLRNHFGKSGDMVQEDAVGYGQPQPKQMDAEVLRMGTRMTYLMMKGGLRSFSDYCEAMKDELPDIFDDMRPHLKSLYAAAQNMEEVMQLGWDEEMDDRKTVKAFDVYNFDKPGAKDIIATAQHTVDEQASQQQTEQIIQTLKDQRNEQRKKEADETSADTEIIVDKAETTASEVESKLEAATTEQDAERLSHSIDKELDEVNKQLALLGYYEAEEVDKDFNEAYGYMRNAERKATQDAHNLATQLATDLGLTIDPKDRVRKSKYNFGSKIAHSNVAPAGGEVYIKLPLAEGRELSMTLSLDKNEPWLERGRAERPDDLVLTRIMFRVEDKTGKSTRYVTSNDFISPTSTYDELLAHIRRSVRHLLPEETVQPATPLTHQPGEDMVQMAERVSKDRKTKKPQVKPEQPIGDLFGGLFDNIDAEADKSQSVTPKTKENEKSNVQPRAEEAGRGGLQPRPNEPLGESAKHEDERTDGGRMAKRGGEHIVSDTERSGSVSQPHQSEQGVTEPKNIRNNHAERGVDYAPKGEKARIDANIAAIELAKKLLASGKTATLKEMEVLRRYSGWGGLGTAFNEGKAWAPNPINKRLRELLTPEEYEAAVMSRNSAYYTPAPVIDAMWNIAKSLGFKGGNIVEGSAGIGNIIGLMPIDISERSNIHAVEIDNTTGGILSLLYPDANVEIQGFEKTRIGNGTVDLAITNVPFVTGLHVMDESGDSDLSKKFRDIHDFCIAKNVRKLREGGIGIFITSSGTLDKSQKLRNWLVSDKDGCADVVGVFRMNNQTFGGTAATSDIIVVRKRVNGRKSANAIDVSTVSVARTASFEDDKGKTKDLPMLINRYFIEHPENMGGEMFFGFEQGDTYRPTSIGLFPTRTADQAERMAAWVQSMADMDWETESVSKPGEQTSHANEALGEGVKEGSMVTDSDGNLCVARMGRAVPLAINKNKIKGRTKEECFKDYSEIKDALTEVLKYQTEHDDDTGLQPLLDRLNTVYDTFVERYGNLNKNNNLAWLRNDVDFSSIVALETYSEKGSKDGQKIKTYGKTDIFSRRVVEKDSEPTPKNVKDGIIASIYKFGRIDPEYLATQLGKSNVDVKKEIIDSGLGFENPTTGQMEVSYEYLSGNVREKLRQAREANEAAGGGYEANIKALEAVVPMNIPAHLIEFTLGSSWVEPKLYERYIKERTGLDVKLTNAGGTWNMNEPYYTDEPKNKEMGVRSEKLDIFIPGHKLIEAAITNKTITVSRTVKDSDGTHTETDPAATTACATKVDEIRQDFKDWAREQMQSDPDLSMRMEEVYNEQFNNSVPKSIPDEFVPEHFGGAATMVGGKPFHLRPHQAKAVIRATTQPVLLAHEVGTGKTYTLITTAMEMRRLGTARKPMIVVQNATVGQFVASAKALYPNAKVLTLEDADRNAEGRRAFYAKIKFNDWDMIVVPQSVFERIPDSIERQTQFIQDKIEEKMLVLEQMKEADPDGKSMIVRSAEREINNLRDEIAQLANGGTTDKKKEKDAKKAAVTRQNAEVKAREMLDRATDDVEDFDSMGIDAVLVDEAHEYKHLGFATAMQRGVKGVDTSYSKKSQGVFLKVQSVLEKTGGKNVVFATGTPISNTAAEIWTFMRYLMPADVMKDYGIYYFDDFVRNFGNLQQMLEFTTSGKYKENNRFAGYVNLPELVRIWSTVADTVLTREAGGVSDKIPQMEGDKAQDIFLPQTRALRSIMKYVKEELDEYDKMSGKEKKENSHIPLVMYGIAKAAAVDARLVQADADDDPNSKTNEAVRQTLRTLEETKNYKGTVAIFADNYQNKTSGFNLYEDIRKKLIDAGVPSEQIVVMKSGMTVNKKLDIFSRVNSGEVRVVMGSTFTLGTGVNIQERLHTLIHLDAPNRPMDYTQRNGRILRQGNLHNEWGLPVRVLRFGVEDSLDVTAYQRLKTKGAIADSIMNGKQLMENSMDNRSLEEEQDLFGDITAQLSGSEYALLKNQIEKEVRKLTAKLKNWEADQTYIHNRKRQIAGQNREAEQRIEANKTYLEKVEAATIGDITVGKLSFPSIDAMEDFFTEQNKKKAELQEKVRKDGYSSRPITNDIVISVGGFDFHVHTEISRETKSQQGSLFYTAPAKMTYSCPELGIEAMPVKENKVKNSVIEIMNDVVSGEDFRGRIEAAERYIERNNAELQSMSARVGVPFKDAEALAQAEEKLAEYEELMKQEMEAKEAKYAELDKDVETASNIELTEEDSDEVISEPVARYSTENSNFASRYETKDGKTIGYTSENPEAYGVSETKERTSDSGSREADIQRQGDNLLAGRNSGLNHEDGEFSLVERIFIENGSFNFTSGEKIESADDVAFIFSALEDAAKEHAFVVYVKDGRPTVVELGMGTFTETMVDIPTASLAYNRIRPDQVYFVHNHPSGNLKCSMQDVQMLQKIEGMCDVPVSGVIINLKTGKYGTFDTSNNTGVGNKRTPESESRLTVHTLDKQIFAPDYDPMAQPLVRMPQDVAQFLNSQRMGDRAKVSFLILSRAGRIVGNIHTPFTEISSNPKEVARYISERVIQFGGESAILYGDFPMSSSNGKDYKRLKDLLAQVGGNTLLDVVRVEGNHTRSANDEGLLYEPGSEYGASQNGDIRFREVEDDAILTEFAEGKTIKAYRTMQVIDGKLYSPMATKVGGKSTPEIKLGVPEQSEEHPEIIKGTKIGRDGIEQGYVVIDKGLGKGTLTVAYNPYAHTSRTVLNDQFSSAYIRPNLVTVEVEVPESELTSGYRASMAKDAVGEISWHSGSVSGQLAELGQPRRVILTRYDRPVRIVPFREVAEMIAVQLDGTDIAIPYNVVQPQLRSELERLGVAISEVATGTVADASDFGKAEYVTDQEIERINAHQQEMAQTSTEAKSNHAERLSKKLGTPIRIVTETNELTNANAEHQARMRKSKGFYDPATGEVVVVIPNNANVEDVAETVFHEVVAHKGLREMIGDENYDAFCDEVYDHLKDDLKKQVDEESTRRFMGEPSKDYQHHRRVAVDEMFGRMAEKAFEDFTKAERGIWTKLKAKVLEAINKFLGSLKLPKWVKLGDNELRYMLWRSHERLRSKGAYVDMARDAVKRKELGLTANDAVRYSTSEDGMQETNRRFNEQLKRWESGEISPEEVVNAGYPMGVMRKFMPRIPISLRQRVLSKSRKKHGLTASEMQNLPGALAKPIFVFKSNEDTVSVLTVLKSDKGENLFVAIELAKDLKLGGRTMEVNDILTIHGREVENVVLPIIENNSLVWADKEKGLDWLLSAKSNSQAITTQTLEDAAKVIQNFENPAIDDGESLEYRFRDGKNDGETGDIWKDMSVGLQERITNAKIRLSNNHSGNLTLRNDAMREVVNNLQNLLHDMRNRSGVTQRFAGADRKVEAGVVRAINAQAMFDRSTVKRVADLARILMQNGYLSDMNSGEVKRLLSAVKNATAMHDIADSVQKIMDVMVDNQLRNGKAALRKLLTIRGSKVDARGVEVQGVLDVDGQRTMGVVKEAMTLGEDDITARIAEAQNRMGDPDQTIADQASLEYASLNMALDYVQHIGGSKAEEKSLRDSLKTAKEDRDAGRMADDAYKQFVEATEDAIRKNKVERAEAYFNLVGRLSGSLRESIGNAKAFREAEKARINEIHHNANSDMEGRPTNEHHKDDWKDKFANNAFVQFLFAPLGTFDQILRVFGNKSANGEGYLWNRFMRGWVDCRNKELLGVKEKFARLDAKAAELFGKGKTWGDLIRMERKLPKATVSFWDGGEMRDHELTQGNLLYIYMVDKMTDGRMKLRRMGITEYDITDIENILDPRFKALGDWLQDEFLVDTRNEYNETHKRMFGASMAAIENYFPLKILANARVDKEEDVNQQNRPDGITTKTGSIIKRRVNNLALDITGADALSVILDHITQMEHWNAYAEWNRDLNTLRTYKRFRNQVINMTTVYGGGRKLWENFNDLCLMAAGEYRPPVSKFNKVAVEIARGVTAAKVNLRIYTALKQFLSAPAYIPEVSTATIAKSIANPYGDFKWCLENMPIFRERWHSRISGDPRLLKTDMDWNNWRERVMEISSRIGMTPNAFVDAVTVSIGARAMYETRLKQYLKEGYPTDAAEKRAMQDATILFNQTQQSSESPFLSKMQADKDWLSTLFTIFRNSSMSYTRQEFDAIRNLKRNLTPGQRAKSVEFMAKQILRDWGVNPDSATDAERDKARSTAKKRFYRQLKKDVLRFGTFGFILPFLWNLGPYLPYIIFGNDDDEKDKMWDDALTHAYFGSVEGLTGGDVMSAFGNMAASGEWNFNQLSKDMPLASDIYTIGSKFVGGKNIEAINDIMNLLVQIGFGWNPQIITDSAIAIIDACGDDPALSHEATIFVMRVLQVPQSQIDKMYFDEIGLSGEEASKLPPAQLAQRYAEYKVKRGTPLAPWSWGDEELVDKQKERATRLMKERLESKSGKEVTKAYADFEERSNAVAKKVKKAKDMMEIDYEKAAEKYAALQQDPDYKLHGYFTELDGDLKKLTRMWLNAKSTEEAELVASTVTSYRAGMVKVLQAETEKEQESAMKELEELIDAFSRKYYAMLPEPGKLNR